MMRPAVSCLFVAVAGVAASCATTYSSFSCPAPVGEIIRQDCEDYRVRYETARAKLSFSLGFLKFGAEGRQEKLRDPSELVQVMMHQMLTLCHDYNACRVENREYRQKREENDRTFTALMALVDQLKAPALSVEARRSLTEELIVTLRGNREAPPSPARPGEPRRKPGDPRVGVPELTEGFFRSPWTYWYRSRFPPPKPPAAAKGIPFVLELVPWWKGATVGHFFARLWGDVQADDELWIRGEDGRRLRCRVTRSRNKPEGGADCRPEHGGKMPSGRKFAAEYTPGVTGVRRELAAFDTDPALPAREAWLAYQPDPIRVDPVTRERPWLIVTRIARKAPAATMRCAVDGKPLVVKGQAVFKALAAHDRMLTGTRQQRFAFALPFVLPYPDSAPVDDERMGDHAGAWVCQVAFDAEPAFEVGFTVRSDGGLEPHARQAGRPGDVGSPWWFVEIRALKSARSNHFPMGNGEYGKAL